MSLPVRRGSLEIALRGAAEGDAPSSAAAEELLHRLAGSAGVHGFPALSEAALRMLARFTSATDRADIDAWSETVTVRFELQRISK